MKWRPAALNRLLVLVVGIVLAIAGATAIAWERNVQFVRDRVAHLDRDRLIAVPEQPWWHWALGTTLAASLILGILVLAVDLTRRRAAPSQLLESATGTPVSIDLGPVATSVAAELATLPGVHRARGRAVSDRGLATISVTLDAAADADVDAITRASERIAATTTSAIDGAEVAVRVLLHLDRAELRD
ncbi:hypothetical protein ERC79_06325 [Rhodococcus sp. ABRD24]|uniref:hypothetical protein n=1 Tax=Rhodococcus sp. ABRD24 TaxID=2507582 RepID=UPI00103FD623|nr:hypothetical protein [Rhodococcus sp. ABRD24]QBJ95630.1 hypothetical protein ERC79_06325 [Rhodococcus sp. ABRD24]